MKPRAWFFAAALVLGAVELFSACSEKVPLQPTDGKCEFDEQCAQGLVCKCVRRRNPDDEGPDEVLSPGTCQVQSFKCTNTDAGGTTTDTGATSADSGADTGAIDSGSDTGAIGSDSATTVADAADAG